MPPNDEVYAIRAEVTAVASQIWKVKGLSLRDQLQCGVFLRRARTASVGHAMNDAVANRATFLVCHSQIISGRRDRSSDATADCHRIRSSR